MQTVGSAGPSIAFFQKGFLYTCCQLDQVTFTTDDILAAHAYAQYFNRDTNC